MSCNLLATRQLAVKRLWRDAYLRRHLMPAPPCAANYRRLKQHAR